MILPRLRTGKDAWCAAIGSSFYLIESVDEDAATMEACDVADRFLSGLRDHAEIHDAITDRGFEAVGAAQRELVQGLDELAQHDLVVFGAQRDMIITGGESAPLPCTMAVVLVRPATEIGDDEELRVASANPSARADLASWR